MTSPNNINEIIITSPRRVNLIGEHIDYNGGSVLPGAIEDKLTLKFCESKRSLGSISSDGYESFEFDIKKPLKISSKQWENYVLGVMDGIDKILPDRLKGFNCSITGGTPHWWRNSILCCFRIWYNQRLKLFVRFKIE